MKKVINAYIKGTAITVTAVALGLAMTRQSGYLLSPWIYSLISLVAFAVGTIGKVGWLIQTWSGDTREEKNNRRIFLSLYFLGVVAGTAAVNSQAFIFNSPASFNSSILNSAIIYLSATPEVVAACVLGLCGIIGTTIAGIVAVLIGKRINKRIKLEEQFKIAKSDIEFLLAVEAAHCENAKISKNKIRASVLKNSSNRWSGRFTSGRNRYN